MQFVMNGKMLTSKRIGISVDKTNKLSQIFELQKSGLKALWPN